jgi:hypothetical protein
VIEPKIVRVFPSVLRAMRRGFDATDALMPAGDALAWMLFPLPSARAATRIAATATTATLSTSGG